MFAVIETYNFDPTASVCLFQEEEEAVAYLQWLWEDCYNEELANGNELDESECWHEDDYAQIKWLGAAGETAFFQIVDVTPPLKGFVRRSQSSLGRIK